jgi:competence protein ComEC
MSPLRDKIFYAIVFGFILGVFFRSFIFFDSYFAILLCVISLAIVLFFIFISKNDWGIFYGFFILAIFFGILRFNYSDIVNPKNFELKVGHNIQIEGLISGEPEIKENNQKFVLSPRTGLGELSSKLGFGEGEVKILVSALFTEEYKYGDIIVVSGKLAKIENFVTDYGKKFDYINYLKKDGIFYSMSFPKIEIISHGNGNKIKSVLFLIKEKFLEKVSLSISEPESLLMGGLILGDKASFSQSLRQSFIDTGTIHIVALSGYNVTIVAEWIMKLFSFLPINFAISIGIIAIILFILMSGASSTAIRAGIMATLALIARATGRNYDVARALMLAGVLMVFFNPLILVYDVSFQLSFIATVAVIFIAPRVEKHFNWITKKFGLRDIVSVTFSAYIFVLPFILYKMGTFSVVALPANILVLPFIPFTMALGFLTGILGFISSTLALPIGFISYLFLHYELFVINVFSKLPFSSFVIPSFPLFFIILIYAYFLYRLFWKNIENFFKTTPL